MKNVGNENPSLYSSNTLLLKLFHNHIVSTALHSSGIRRQQNVKIFRSVKEARNIDSTSRPQEDHDPKSSNMA